MRYAIYWCPDDGDPLLTQGASWLGRSLTGTAPLPRPEIAGMSGNRLAALTASASLYGFHATLKAPMHLKDGIGERHLLDAVAGIADKLAPVPMPPLAVASLGRFLALRPVRDQAPLAALAAQIVTGLDPLRRPLQHAEQARRRSPALTPREDALLRRWGYPYVLDAYRFHLTLSDPLDAAAASDLRAAAELHFAAALVLPRSFDAVAVFLQPEPGAPFRLLTRLRLGSAR